MKTSKTPAPLARGIIFDFDGTLYGDWRIWISIIEETLADFHIPVTPLEALEEARRMVRTGDFVNSTIRISGVATALAREKGFTLDEEVKKRFFERLDAKMDDAGPGEKLNNLLNRFSQEDFRMGIVTFVRSRRILRRLEVWRLKDYFRSVITPDEVPEFKPSPEPFLRAMKDLEVTPRRCFVVGDEPVDMMGGKKAGATTVGLPVGFYSKAELEDAGADHIIGDIDLLPTIVHK